MYIRHVTKVRKKERKKKEKENLRRLKSPVRSGRII